MHEHIDEMGIINMNGRIYDPLIGRFMSADPYIQAPDDLQSHNRYAYVMNNPLNLTDPSGFSWLSKTWKKAWKSPIFRAVLGIVVAVVAPYLLHAIAPTLFVIGSLPTALATGALSGFASTGTLKGALTGAFTAGVMFGVGEIGKAFELADGGIAKIALHAGAGCASSVTGGGSCKTGAMSGALGEFGHNIDVGSSFAAGVAKSAMMGGIGSKLAGGKFADGAITGSFGYLFNFCSHAASCWKQAQEDFGAAWKKVFIDPFQPDYVTVQGGALSPQGGASMNLRDGSKFVSGGVVKTDPRATSFKPGVSASVGWVFGANTASAVNDFLGGSGGGAYVSIPSGPVNTVLSVNQSYTGGTAIEIGIGSPGKLSGGIVPINHATQIPQ